MLPPGQGSGPAWDNAAAAPSSQWLWGEGPRQVPNPVPREPLSAEALLLSPSQAPAPAASQPCLCLATRPVRPLLDPDPGAGLSLRTCPPVTGLCLMLVPLAGLHPDPDQEADFPAWPWTCFISADLADLNLRLPPWPALLHRGGQWGRPGWQASALLARGPLRLLSPRSNQPSLHSVAPAAQ